MNFLRICRRIENRIQVDEGGRGIQMILPEGPCLLPAVERIRECQSVLILTGFPCLFSNRIQIETDGLAGSLAVGRSLERQGRSVTIIIDPQYESILQDLVTWHNSEFSSNLQVSSSLSLSSEGIISIERAGRSQDGNYYTMRGLPMQDLSPLDSVYLDNFQGKVRVAIGDGGNEAGLGPVREKVEKFIKNGEKIASCSKSDFILISSVSTWGAYGLSFALDKSFTSEFAVNVEGERKVSEKMMEIGICDGITGIANLGVDGLDWSETEKIIKDLEKICRDDE
jgi:hypothetical protein